MKKPSIKGIIVKVCIVIAIWSVYLFIKDLLSTPTNNQTAILQMQDSNEALVSFKTYQYLWPKIDIGLIILSLLLFIKEIKFGINELFKKED